MKMGCLFVGGQPSFLRTKCEGQSVRLRWIKLRIFDCGIRIVECLSCVLCGFILACGVCFHLLTASSLQQRELRALVIFQRISFATGKAQYASHRSPEGGLMVTTDAHSENSDVLSFGSIAVAVMYTPGIPYPGNFTEILA